MYLQQTNERRAGLRMLLNILVSLAITYAAIAALVFVFQTRLIYFPETAREYAVSPQAYGLAFDSLKIGTEDGETLHGWWIPAPSASGPARGIVLLFHGNAGNISHRLDYAKMFNSLGYSSLLVDYRGYGQSSGTPTEEGTYRDAAAAWLWLTQTRGAKGPDIVIAGESLGGGVASWLAVQNAPRALLLMSTFTSIPDMAAKIYPFLPVRLITRIQYDNLSNIRRIKAPVLIAHSRQDDLVPVEHGQQLFAAANEPKQFLEMRGGHNEGFIFAREEWVREVAGFLERHAPRQ